MHGSWHRYRPGERWRRPPARARLVIEVPGAVAVCFDAPTVELFEQRAEALHPTSASSGRTCSSTRSTSTRRFAGSATRPSAGSTIGEALLDQRALAGIGNEVRNQALWEARVSPFRPVDAVDDATLRDARRVDHGRSCKEGARTGRRPSDIHGRTGRPCPRCGTLIRSEVYGTRAAAAHLLVPRLPARSAAAFRPAHDPRTTMRGGNNS